MQHGVDPGVAQNAQPEEKQEDQDTPDTAFLLSKNHSLSLSKGILFSISILFLSIIASLLKISRKKKEHTVFESALPAALKELQTNNDFPAILKKYLNTKLNKNFSALTLKEIHREHLSKILDPTLSNECGRILTKLENFLYNPSQEFPEDFKEEFIKFLTALDAEI